MDKRELALGVARLREDIVLMTVTQRIKDEAVRIFLDATSSLERIEKAHETIRGLSALERAFAEIEGDSAIAEKRGKA